MSSNKRRLLSVFGGTVLGIISAGATGMSYATPGHLGSATLMAASDDKAKDTDKQEEEPRGDLVDVDKLPKVVLEAVKKAMPGARITKAMKLADGNFYLDDVKVGKKLWDITITPKGKILKKVEMKEGA